MNAPQALHDLAGAEREPEEWRLAFVGSGGAYFRIWIVNLALTILTLGIYSAWAKVRRERYFLNNTELDGSPFDYHADPMNILKGRLLAGGIIMALLIVAELHPLANLLASLTFMLLLPWMIGRSLRFRAHNTSWRGLRFSFRGSGTQAAMVWLIWPLLGVLSLGLLLPPAIAAQWRYKLDNLRFGRTRFSIEAGAGPIYRTMLAASLLGLGLALVGAVLIMTMFLPLLDEQLAGAAGDRHQASPPVLATMLSALWLALVVRLLAPYLRVRLDNLRARMMRLQEHRFLSDQRARDIYLIMAGNGLLTVLTLGLFRPFAVVRLWRYRVEHFAVLAAGGSDEFVAGASGEAPVLGAEAADLLDVDFGF